MNKKFILVIVAFTLTVPGFFLFSYWYLGIFSSVDITEIDNFDAVIYAGRHQGDYNKTGGEVVKTRKIVMANGLVCEPVLVYFENAITTGKPNLHSAGGCRVNGAILPHVLQALRDQNREKIVLKVQKGYRLKTYAQTAVALRKVWTELARLSDKGINLKFPLVHLVRENGDSEFLIGIVTDEK
jgi:hypothetical protein